MKRILWMVIGIVVLMTGISYVTASSGSKPVYQPIREGERLVFEDGVLYQRPGAVLQLVVRGSHYQMGKQYGVLLRPELQYSITSLERMLALIAKGRRVPLWMVEWYVRYQASRISHRLPKRFLEEMKGVAEGSGLPYQKILMVNMIYDIYRLTGCTGVIWKSPSGAIYHGHTTDIGWGMEWPKTIMVQYHPTDYFAFTSITWAGFLGTQTAYNQKGLCYSENTLVAKKINPRGFSVNYLARMAMEECDSLDRTEQLFDHYNTINGEALYFSDLKHGKASVIETTPLSPTVWAEVPMQHNLIWGINLYQNSDLAKNIQDDYQTKNGFNAGRQKILRAYFSKTHEYNLENMIDLLRSSIGPEGKDYAKNPFLAGVSNDSGLQMIIYDPQGKGVYLATGNYYASRNSILFYPDDFSQPPSLFKSGSLVDPILNESGRILNSITSAAGLYEAWNRLANKYPNEPFLQVYTGWAALRIGNKQVWANKFFQAYHLEPEFPEYKVLAASAAFYQNDFSQVINLLRDLNPGELISPKYQGLRLALLVKSYQPTDGEIARKYSNELKLLYQEYRPLKRWVESYFKQLKK